MITILRHALLVMMTGAGLLAPACEAPSRTRLPAMANVVVEVVNPDASTAEGVAPEPTYASLLVEFPAPRRKPVLRVFLGILAFDGVQLHHARLVPRAVEGGQVQDVLFTDLLADSEVMVQLAPPDAHDGQAAVANILQRTAVVHGWGEGWERWLEVGLDDARMTEVDGSDSTRRFLHYGPGQGFMMYVEEDTLTLRLPFGEDVEAIPLMDGVTEVVAVRWISDREFSADVERLLDSTFKMAGALRAQARTCSVDGDLSEWSRDDAMAVGQISQIMEGEEYWSGVRDGSVSLAARLTPDALCLAVRLRDDDILPQRDQVDLYLSDTLIRIPIPAQPERVEGEGYTLAFADQVAFGTGFEICIDPSLWTAVQGRVHFRALFYDHDTLDDDSHPQGADGDLPHEGVTVLATAPDVPWTSIAGIMLPRRAVGGVLNK